MSSDKEGKIRILIVEHNTDDIALLMDELKSGDIDFVAEIVKEKDAYRNALYNFTPDIILSDYSLPAFHGDEAFVIREELSPVTPFLFVSGSIGEERSIEYIRSGVTDYVLKDKLFTLSVKIKRALLEARERQEKIISQQQLIHYAGLLEKAQQLAHLGSWEFSFVDLQFTLSAESCKIFGFEKTKKILPFKEWSEMVHADDLDNLLKTFNDSVISLSEALYNHRIILRNGSMRDIYAESKFEMDTSGKVTGLFGIIQDVTDRNRNESALRDAYNEKITVLERIDDGFFAIDEHSTIIYWNKKAELLLDFKKEAVIGKNLHTVFASTSSNVFYNHYQEALLEKKTVHFREFSIRTKRWFEVSAYPSDNGLSVYFKDVTESKIAGDKLKESELRYRSLNEQATDAICIADASMRFIEINPYACEVFGYTKQEALEMSLPDILFTEDLATNPLKMDELKLGKTIRNERRLKRKDGSEVYMEVSTKIMDDGRLIMFGHDITDRKKAEEEREALSTLLNKANALARIGSWEVDLEANTLFWSAITREIHEVETGFTPNVQTALSFYKTGESRDSITSALATAIQNGTPWDMELQVVTAKHNEKWVRAIGEVEFKSGRCVKVSGSFQDITQRKVAEIHLQELNEEIGKHAKELAISNAELEQFAYVASHDLQEPLRMITSFLTQLEKRYGSVLDEKGKQYIEFAVNGAKRMRQIILDLLDYSRVGQSEENQVLLDLNEVVSQIQILFNKKIEDKNARITVDELPKIFGHRAPIHQIFQNLIGNALKYSVDDKPCEIHVSVSALADQWQFSVSDNGIGIAEEYFDKIFIIFQRLHNNSAYSGTGMGLAVTKKIIENLGGKIWVTSIEGKGSTFYFTLNK